MNVEYKEDPPSEAEVKRLRGFEEANIRLRKYNGELRKALALTQAVPTGRIHPIVQIPEGDGHELFSNDRVDVCPSPDVPILNSVILDVVFNMMNYTELKNCRLICKKWNEGAYRILFRPRKGLPVQLHLGDRIKEPEDIVAALKHISPRIEALPLIIAKAPDDWFRRAYVDKSFLGQLQIQSILQDFGYRLMTIHTSGPPFLFQDIQNILVDWCPNLQRLAFSRLTVKEGEEYQKLLLPQPLKLIDLCMAQTLCLEIVKASPHLKSLGCGPDNNNLKFFKQFQTCPDITKNLEELIVIFKFPIHEEDKTELRYMADRGIPIKSIVFLIDMPNLRVLYLGREFTYPSKRSDDPKEFIDNLFSNSQQLVNSPHKNLKELYLFGIVKKPSRTFEMMNQMFPNMKTLTVGLFTDSHLHNKSEVQKYYEGAFQALSKSPNLKKLYLDFRNTNGPEQNEYQGMPFPLKHLLGSLSSLEHLTIRNQPKTIMLLEFDMPENLIVKLTKLRLVTLIGISLDLMTAKQLSQLLYKHDIHLEIKDDAVLEDFRVHNKTFMD